MISVRPVGGRVTVGDKNFNVAIFSNTVNMINVKLCMMVMLIKLYPFIPLSLSLTIFQGHTNMEQF